MPSGRISNTTPYTTYKMWVTAKNAIGEGETAGPVSARFGGCGPAVISYPSGDYTKTSFTGDGVNGVLDQDYEVYAWDGAGGFVVQEGDEGLCDLLIVGGGGAGMYYYSNTAIMAGGGAGAVLHVENTVMPFGSHSVEVGEGEPMFFTNRGGKGGGASSISALEWMKSGGGASGNSWNDHTGMMAPQGGGGSGGAARFSSGGGIAGAGAGGKVWGGSNDQAPRNISITETSQPYGSGGPGGGATSTARGSGGSGINGPGHIHNGSAYVGGSPGIDGIVIVRVAV